ncbi:hypothetical protein [Aerolutibacter ruishenii]|uniref:Uncharacterized protein n=1 Tax=Aerolutibacter ruishenii TaxID=686800 RepID=A0A562LYI6_9GAMM|nr:hypothetical protein [Lysobacter ruishenii]TWI12717.1 hypothetical protein IP93_01062 [Lysobacter ruishenii]
MSAQVIPFPRAMTAVANDGEATPELLRLADLIAERVRRERQCTPAEAVAAARAAMRAG